MGNLNYSATDILLNSVSVDKVGLFFATGDGPENVATLLIKQLGITIPGALYDDGVFDTARHIRCTKNCSQAGQLKEVRYELAPLCPCEECNFEYGITVQHQDSPAGEQIRYFAPPQKFYGNKIKRVECTDGFINDDYVLRMEDDIISQIDADDHAFVTSYRGYDFGEFAAGDSITFTLVRPGEEDEVIDVDWTDDPVAITFAAFIALIETAIDGLGITVIGDDATDTIVIVGDPGLLFTITPSDPTSISRYLYIKQKYPEVSFNASYSEDFATAEVITECIYPSLRGVDVYKEFINRGNHGSMAMFTAMERPDPAANYCKYTFTVLKTPTYDLVGANHLNDYYHIYHLYVKEDQVDVYVWKATEYNVEVPPAIGDADTSLEDLIDILCGLNQN